MTANMAIEANCDGCAFNNAANLKKLGVNVSNVNFVVALAGTIGHDNAGEDTTILLGGGHCHWEQHVLLDILRAPG